MKSCMQTEGQSVYEHGLSVKEHMDQLIHYLHTEEISGSWALPSWLPRYRKDLLGALMPKDVIDEYLVYHDCGKPYCKPDGKRRFPNHAEVSYWTWLAVGGRSEAARLMKFDMMIHTMKAKDLDTFVSLPEAPTLLLAGLAEIHSNAKMFGGRDSESFKIKWNQIDRRGRAICRKLFCQESDHG